MARHPDHQVKNGEESPLFSDEKVLWVRELDADKPMWGPHRYQHIILRRGERELLFRKDLGPSILYPNAHPFQFFAGGEYSVGEALEISERLREGKPPEETPPSDLIQQRRDELEELKALRTRRSTSGPHITIQR